MTYGRNDTARSRLRAASVSFPNRDTSRGRASTSPSDVWEVHDARPQHKFAADERIGQKGFAALLHRRQQVLIQLALGPERRQPGIGECSRLGSPAQITKTDETTGRTGASSVLRKRLRRKPLAGRQPDRPAPGSDSARDTRGDSRSYSPLQSQGYAEQSGEPMCASLVRGRSLCFSMDQSCVSTDHMHLSLDTHEDSSILLSEFEHCRSCSGVRRQVACRNRTLASVARSAKYSLTHSPGASCVESPKWSRHCCPRPQCITFSNWAPRPPECRPVLAVGASLRLPR